MPKFAEQVAEVFSNTQDFTIAQAIRSFTNDMTNALYEGELEESTIKPVKNLIDGLKAEDFTELNVVLSRLVQALIDDDKREDCLWALLQKSEINVRTLPLLCYTLVEYCKEHQSMRTFLVVQTYFLLLRIPGNSVMFQPIVFRSCMNTIKLWADTHAKAISEAQLQATQEKRGRKRPPTASQAIAAASQLSQQSQQSRDDEDEEEDPFADIERAHLTERKWMLEETVNDAVHVALRVAVRLLQCHFDIEQLLLRQATQNNKADGLTIGTRHFLCLQQFPEVLTHTVETFFECARVSVAVTVPGIAAARTLRNVAATAYRGLSAIAQLNAHGNGAFGLSVVLKSLLPCLTLRNVVLSGSTIPKAELYMRNQALEFITSLVGLCRQDQRRITLLLEQEEKESRSAAEEEAQLLARDGYDHHHHGASTDADANAQARDQQEDAADADAEAAGLLTLRKVEREVAAVTLGPYTDDFLELRAQLEAEAAKDEEQRRKRAQEAEEEDEDLLERRHRQQQEHLAQVRSRLIRERLLALLTRRTELLGTTVYQAMSTFLKHMVLVTHDKAPARRALTSASAQLVQAYPPCLSALCRFLARMSIVGRPAARLQAVEMAHALLANSTLFHGGALQSDPDSIDESLGRDVVAAEEEEAVHNDNEPLPPLTTADLVGPAQQLLSILLARTCDKAAAVRAKALNCVADCVTQCVSAEHPLLRQQFRAIMSGAAEAAAAAQSQGNKAAAANLGSIFSPLVSRVAARTADTVAAPIVAQAHAPSTPFHPTLSGVRQLFTILRARAADPRPAVRKAALQAVEGLVLGAEDDEEPRARARRARAGHGGDMNSAMGDDDEASMTDEEEEEAAAPAASARVSTALALIPGADLTVIFDACRDVAPLIRKQAILSLSALLTRYPDDPRVAEMWLGGILPLCADAEASVQDKAMEVVRARLFLPLGTQVKALARAQLPPANVLLEVCERCDGATLRHLHKCIASALRKAEAPALAIELVSLVNSGMDVCDSILFWAVAEQVALAFPHHVRADVAVRALVRVGVALKGISSAGSASRGVGIAGAKALLQAAGVWQDNMFDYADCTPLRNYDGGVGIHGNYPPAAVRVPVSGEEGVSVGMSVGEGVDAGQRKRKRPVKEEEGGAGDEADGEDSDVVRTIDLNDDDDEIDKNVDNTQLSPREHAICAYAVSVYRVLTNICLAHTLAVKVNLHRSSPALPASCGRLTPLSHTCPDGSPVSASVADILSTFSTDPADKRAQEPNTLSLTDETLCHYGITHPALIYLRATLARSLLAVEPSRVPTLPLLHAKAVLMQAAGAALQHLHAQAQTHGLADQGEPSGSLPALAACDGKCIRARWERDLLAYCSQLLQAHTSGARRVPVPVLVWALFCVGEIALETDHGPLASGLLSAMQTLLPPTLSVARDAPEDTEAANSSVSAITRMLAVPVPPLVRAHAFLAIGKAMLRDLPLCKRLLAVFVRELRPQTATMTHASPWSEARTRGMRDEQAAAHHVLRNNILLLLCDLCRVFTSAVDPHIPTATVALADPHVSVRRQALLSLSQLLLEDFIKWRGTLFFRILSLVVDRDASVRALAEQSLSAAVRHTLTQTQQHKVEQHFVEALFFFNACRVHRSYNQQRDMIVHDEDDALFAPNNSTTTSSSSGSSLGSEGGSAAEDRIFTLEGPRNKPRRMAVYEWMLSQLGEEQKLRVSAKLATDILGGIADGSLPVVGPRPREEHGEERFRGMGSSDMLTRHIVGLLAQRRREREKEAGDGPALASVRVLTQEEQASVAAVVDDALDILCGAHIRLSSASTAASEEEDVDKEAEAVRAVQTAKTRILGHIQRKHVVEQVLPLAVEAKRVLERARHPLCARVLEYLCTLMQQHHAAVSEVIAGDSRLKEELLYDLRAHEERQKEKEKEKERERRAAAGGLPHLPVPEIGASSSSVVAMHARAVGAAPSAPSTLIRHQSHPMRPDESPNHSQSTDFSSSNRPGGSPLSSGALPDLPSAQAVQSEGESEEEEEARAPASSAIAPARASAAAARMAPAGMAAMYEDEAETEDDVLAPRARASAPAQRGSAQAREEAKSRGSSVAASRQSRGKRARAVVEEEEEDTETDSGADAAAANDDDDDDDASTQDEEEEEEEHRPSKKSQGRRGSTSAGSRSGGKATTKAAAAGGASRRGSGATGADRKRRR